jgi:hypothetical protein
LKVVKLLKVKNPRKPETMVTEVKDTVMRANQEKKITHSTDKMVLAEVEDM